MLEDWDVERYEPTSEVRAGELGVQFVRARDREGPADSFVLLKLMPNPTLELLERRSLGALLGRELTEELFENWIGTERFPTLAEFFSTVRASFAAEADTVAKLRHPGVLRLLDRGETWRWTYHVYELGERTTLADYCEERPLPLEDALVIGAQLADVLATLHAEGLVHPFAHPANLLVEQNLHLRVTGFAFGWEWMNTTAVPAYSPPEQIFANERTPKGDVYVLGGVLWKMLTGSPWVTGDDQSFIAFHATPPPVDAESRIPGCPRWLARLLRGCLAVDPAARPTAQQVLDELEGRVPPPGIPAIAAPAADLLTTRWSQPLRAILQDLVRVRSPELAWRRLLELGEAVVKLSVVVGAGLSGAAIALPPRPSLGDWTRPLRVELAGARLALLGATPLRTLEEAVSWRNELAHGAMGDAARALEAVRGRGVRLLDVLAASPALRRIEWDDELRFDGARIDTAWIARRSACATCHRSEPFFFNGVLNNGKGRKYLSYETGHTLVEGS